MKSRPIILKAQIVPKVQRRYPRKAWFSAFLWVRVLLSCVFGLFVASPAWALPSFAVQTSQACSACHVGAFGPQLKSFGRDFKLYAYSSDSGVRTPPPISVMAIGSFTHTQSPEPPAPDFARNDNFAIDQVSLFYGGKLFAGAGMFGQFTYDGVSRRFSLDNLDARYAKRFDFGPHNVVLGVDVNNNPGVQDLWNSTPAWRFSYSSSLVAQTPAASALVDGALAGKVGGGGLYSMWDNALYLETAVYGNADERVLDVLGDSDGAYENRYNGAIPYWRVALQHTFGRAHYLEVGGYGLSADRAPHGIASAGVDRLSDQAFDLNYQFSGGKTQFVSLHATAIREAQDLVASSTLFGLRRNNTFDEARADVSYSFKDTWTPTLQWFQSAGSPDPTLYSAPGSRPDSQGYVLELAYSPFGKPHMGPHWFNWRAAIQYVGYTKFDGYRAGASGYNTLYVNLWLAAAPLAALTKH